MTDRPLRIELWDLVPMILASEARRESGPLFCDCYIDRVERFGTPVPWGWSLWFGQNIDHHAPVPRMAREVSSANLAMHWMAQDELRSHGPVVVTHTDCDSILSAGIVAGRLEPGERYGVAAIAADHTGEENAIADLLQAIQDRRDVEYSLEMLRRLESGAALPSEARDALDDRLRKRDAVARAVAEGRFGRTGTIWWAEFDEEMDGEFLPALLPDAELIVVATPYDGRSLRRVIKVRRGRATPEGVTLDDIPLKAVDPAYGGRWNAGSTKRGGGSPMVAEEFVRRLAALLVDG